MHIFREAITILTFDGRLLKANILRQSQWFPLHQPGASVTQNLYLPYA